MKTFTSLAQWLEEAEQKGSSLSQIVIQLEQQKAGLTQSEVEEKMAERLMVMEEAVQTGLNRQTRSFSGLSGGDGWKMKEHLTKSSLLGATAAKAAAYAIAVSEVNASMGKIVACPTAGSCGIMPGALLAVAEALQATQAQKVAALFTASGVGMVIDSKAFLAGAQGGCQAECGSGAAMAAAGVTELAGGSPRQALHAAALALKNLLGLTCDPVAGLVEVPCVKRNGFGAVHALTAAELALSGIESFIPPDEVIEAMRQTGLMMPCSLKETSEAGLAKTPTAVKVTKELFSV